MTRKKKKREGYSNLSSQVVAWKVHRPRTIYDHLTSVGLYKYKTHFIFNKTEEPRSKQQKDQK